MRNSIPLILSLVALFSCTNDKEPIEQVIDRSMQVAKVQAIAMANELYNQEGRMPRNYNPETGEFVTSGTKWWCSGFFPGVLWYLYEYNKEDSLRNLAGYYSDRIEEEKFNTYDHDIGFQIYCSFGNGVRLTGSKDYEEVLKTAGRSATERFNPNIGAIRSWDWSNDGLWQYPVIIDNMMNLELLMWNFKHTGDSVYYNIAVSHADKTLDHLLREDNSIYHLVSFDTITGDPHLKQTVQGAFDESIWARGHAWGLYGFTMMYRETGNQRYLDKATAIADLLIHHPNMPDDMIPYWDLLADGIPDTSRDASAAAIMASGLIELSGFAKDETRKKEYLSVAKQQIRTLASPEYLAEPGSNGHFILKNSVGHYPNNSEVDVALTYADYYFVEALVRLSNL